MTNSDDALRGTPEHPLDEIFTLPNAITVVRLCLVPAFIIALFNDQNVLAMVLFAVAACSDFVDGQLARFTNSVSKIGRVLDPAVDRLLMISGVVCVYLTGRIPAWVIALVLGRDLLMIAGYGIFLKKWEIRIDVIFAGKVCTTLFFIGFAALILYAPLLPGLGWVDAAWLPGFSHQPYCWGIWFIYAGLLLGLFTTTYYVRSALHELRLKKAAAR